MAVQIATAVERKKKRFENNFSKLTASLTLYDSDIRGVGDCSVLTEEVTLSEQDQEQEQESEQHH